MLMTSRRTHVIRVRLDDTEWEYLRAVSDALGSDLSKAFRFILHNSLLLTVMDREEIQRLRDKLVRSEVAKEWLEGS